MSSEDFLSWDSETVWKLLPGKYLLSGYVLWSSPPFHNILLFPWYTGSPSSLLSLPAFLQLLLKASEACRFPPLPSGNFFPDHRFLY